MTLCVSTEVQELVEQELALGEYRSPDDVLLEAVWLLHDRNEKVRQLRKLILPALESLDRGEGRPLDMARIKAEAARRLDEAISKEAK